MSSLLQVDSSPLGDASVTRSLTSEFVRNWKQAHPDGDVIVRDLTQTLLPVINSRWVAATATPADRLTPAQRDLLKLSDELIDELQRTDEWVFGVPMHNFTVPAVLRLWLDQVVRARKTFYYNNGKSHGMLKDKTAHFFIATGSMYEPGSPVAAMDFVEPYLRAIFAFIGVTDTHFHIAGGAAAIKAGQIGRDEFLEPHFEAIREHFSM